MTVLDQAMKTCPKCERSLPLTAFDRWKHICRQCHERKAMRPRASRTLRLTERDWELISRGGTTLQQLADKYGITRERVRQLERDAWAKVGRLLGTGKLLEMLRPCAQSQSS